MCAYSSIFTTKKVTLLTSRVFSLLKYLSMRTKVSLAFTVALLNITSSIFNRKLHIEKHLYRGEFAGIYQKYNIFSLFLADRENVFCPLRSGRLA